MKSSCHVRFIAVQVALFLALSFLLSVEVRAKDALDARILKVGMHVSGIGTLDPHKAAGSQDRAVADMVFNGLLRYVPGNAPLVEPDIAESMPQFEINDGRQEWTISLKKGVMFHPVAGLASYELTADDVVFSLKKAADSKYSSYAGAYSSWQVFKIDSHRIKIILDKPISPILFFPKLTNYAGGFIVSKKAVEKMGYDKFLQHPVGTGPFAFSQYTQGKVLTLVAHRSYFRGHPKLSGVEVHFYPDLQERELLFQSEELDVIIGSGEKGWGEKLEKMPGVIFDTFGVGEVATLYFNTVVPPFDDQRVRNAVFHALDRASFMQTTSSRIAGPVFSPVPEMFLPGGLTEGEVRELGLLLPKDTTAAKKLLAEAGYANGFSLDLVTSEKRVYKSLYKVLAEKLETVGITCNVKEVEHSDMHRIIRKESMPLVIYAAWRPNADAYLTRFFHSDSIIVKGKKPDTNFTYYTAVDKIIENARLEIYPEKQINLWKQAQVRILSDAVAFPLLYTKQLYVRKSSVDYGHALNSTMALYPQITENTTFTDQ